MSIKIAICQVKFRVGDLEGNLKRIINLSTEYSEQGVNLIVFPELALTGYMARDLFLNKSFLRDVQNATDRLIRISKGLDLTIILPCPYTPLGLQVLQEEQEEQEEIETSMDKGCGQAPDAKTVIHTSCASLEYTSDSHEDRASLCAIDNNQNGVLYNAAIAIYKGRVIGVSSKKHLPNFDLFDEPRYFTPGFPGVMNIKLGESYLKLGVAICRDIWHQDVCAELKKQGAELLISLNASPFAKCKHEQRVQVVKERYLETGLPIIYCNHIMGHDGIIFEGKSFGYDGHHLQISPAFKESVSIVELTAGKLSLIDQSESDHQFASRLLLKPFSIDYSRLDKSDAELGDIYNAMVLGSRDYVIDSGFSRVIIGISGGIDSAMVAAICADAFGSENVTGVMMPSPFSSFASRDDAITLADNLDIELLEIPIKESCESMANALGLDFDWKSADITMQNIQSRIRGLILMAIANHSNDFSTGLSKSKSLKGSRIVRQCSNIESRSINGSLLITTGNKSEYATGYATIYGDMNGAFNPIKDIYKTELLKLALFRNKIAGLTGSVQKEIIPSHIINKPPSAELTSNQKDSDSLPEYAILDDILEMHIEQNLSMLEISKKHPLDMVKKVLKLVNISEFKRQQSAPGVRISSKSFNIDRRYPITSAWGH